MIVSGSCKTIVAAGDQVTHPPTPPPLAGPLTPASYSGDPMQQHTPPAKSMMVGDYLCEYKGNDSRKGKVNGRRKSHSKVDEQNSATNAKTVQVPLEKEKDVPIPLKASRIFAGRMSVAKVYDYVARRIEERSDVGGDPSGDLELAKRLQQEEQAAPKNTRMSTMLLCMQVGLRETAANEVAITKSAVRNKSRRAKQPKKLAVSRISEPPEEPEVSGMSIP
jgi:hypothetical protein